MGDLMEADSRMAPHDFTVRIGEDEIGRILNLKDGLDHSEALVKSAARYLRLGWDLVGVNGQGVDDLGVDFCQPEAVWSERLANLGLEKSPLNLGIRTGLPSQLMVLEVPRGRGEAALDQWGQWRSDCVALAANREQHYYALEPHWQLPPSGFLDGPQVMVFAAGGLVLTPPSIHPEAHQPLQWLEPPWSCPPQPPRPAVWQFLREHFHAGLGPDAGGAASGPPPMASWEETYRAISAHEPVLRSLLAPSPSPADYYQGVLQAALAAGLRQPEILLGLLCHAPLGEARRRPQGWRPLQQMVAAALNPSSPGQSLWLEELGEHLVQLRENLPGSFGEIRADLEQQGAPRAAPPEPRSCPGGELLVQPLAEFISFMKDRVIVERGRYEAMLFELGKLSNRTAELERRVAGAAVASHPQAVEPPPPPQPVKNSSPEDAPPARPADGVSAFLKKWTANLQQMERQRQHVSEVQEAINDFLTQNLDLAQEERKVKMVDYCLTYYINSNKELAGLPIRDRLERAGKMARSFLTG